MDFLDLDFNAKNLIVFVLLFLIGFTSCTSSYKVILNEDNSAIVESELPYGVRETEKFTQSELITVLDTVNYRLKFKIKTIDSLGSYLQGVPSGIIEFEARQDTLIVNSSKPLNFKEEGINKFHLSLIMESEDGLNPIQLDKKTVSKINSNSIRINKTQKQLRNQGKKLIVKVIH